MPQLAGSFTEEQAEHRILLDGWSTATTFDNTTHRNRLGTLSTRLNFLQINLQHSRLATDNLMKIKEEEDTHIVCIQKRYNIGNKIGGLPRSHTVLASGVGKKRASSHY